MLRVPDDRLRGLGFSAVAKPTVLGTKPPKPVNKNVLIGKRNKG